MPKYLIRVCWRNYGTVAVDAATPEEAAERAQHMNPDDTTGSCVDDWTVFGDDIIEHVETPTNVVRSNAHLWNLYRRIGRGEV